MVRIQPDILAVHSIVNQNVTQPYIQKKRILILLSIKEGAKEHKSGHADREHMLEGFLCHAKNVGLIL